MKAIFKRILSVTFWILVVFVVCYVIFTIGEIDL